MSSDVVIRADGLGKKYLIGHQAERERYTALRDVITRNARNLSRSVSDLFAGRPNVSGDAVEEFWALKDISFEIKRGDVVGVIGRNGAGKSTLLKVLSRITEPTEGRVEIRGRVASLLEVGTGFHPELTGRENIYLNGAILGMTRAEIKRKFDEIVAFAEVEKFLDTPVKRYSSGMYVRLAFAVAAHMEPEILVVDEVLAVGDAEFQKKCIGKMEDVAQEGRTIIFVSHQLDAVSRLCHRVIVMHRGALVCSGPTAEVIQGYQACDHPTTASARVGTSGTTVWARLERADFSPSRTSTVDFSITFDHCTSLTDACVIFYSLTQQRVALVDLRAGGLRLSFDPHVPTIFRIALDRFMAVSSEYNLTLWISGNLGASELQLGCIQIPVEQEPTRLSLYPEMLNGIIRTYGSVAIIES